MSKADSFGSATRFPWVYPGARPVSVAPDRRGSGRGPLPVTKLRQRSCCRHRFSSDEVAGSSLPERQAPRRRTASSGSAREPSRTPPAPSPRGQLPRGKEIDQRAVAADIRFVQELGAGHGVEGQTQFGEQRAATFSIRGSGQAHQMPWNCMLAVSTPPVTALSRRLPASTSSYRLFSRSGSRSVSDVTTSHSIVRLRR